MSQHVFGAVITHHGTAANNRGETDSNITTLQKLLWHGRVHTTVSAESIRFAVRRWLATVEDTNRYWNEKTRVNEWRDPTFSGYEANNLHIDDDLLGFMSAEAAKADGSDSASESGVDAKDKKKAAKGKAYVRRAVLEVSRAISLSPFAGDLTFNAASPGATPSAAKGDKKNPVPYGTEVHATRYQYGFAMTPKALLKPERALAAVRALCSLGEVAGNHGRFLYDFSPESVVFRLTEDPAPRILYIFEEINSGRTVHAPELIRRVESGDVQAKELIIGGSIASGESGERLKKLGATLEPGVRKAAELVCDRLSKNKGA